MAQNFFKPSHQQILFQGILALIAGALLLVYPGVTVLTIIRFIGFLLLSLVFFNLITAYMNNRKYGDNPLMTVGGTMLLLLGGLLLFFPTMFVKTFLVFIGIVLVFAGISQILVAVQFKLLKGFAWINLLIGAAILAGGVFIISRPKDAASSLTSLIGLFIMIHGFSEIFLSSRIKHVEKVKNGDIKDAEYEELD